MSTRAQAVSALAAGFVFTVIALIWVFSNGSPEKVGRDPAGATITEPLADALRYIPRSAPAVAVIDTDTGAGPLRKALDLLGSVPGGPELGERVDTLLTESVGVSPTDDGAALAGSPLVVSATGSTGSPKLLAAWVTPDAGTLAGVIGSRVQGGELADDGSYRGATTFLRSDGGGAVAQDGRLLLVAADKKTLRTALDRGVRRGASAATGLTPESFASRSASGVSATAAVIRLGISGPMLRRFVSDLQPNAGQLPYLAAVDRAGIGIRTDANGLHLKVKLRTDEGILTEADLPLAPGSEAPELTGEEPIRVGVRSPAQTGTFILRSLRLIAPARLKTYDAVKELIAKFGKVDLETDVLGTLTGSATLAVADSTVTLRARSGDPEKVRTTLQQLSRLGPVSNYSGGSALPVSATGLSLKPATDVVSSPPDDSEDPLDEEPAPDDGSATDDGTSTDGTAADGTTTGDGTATDDGTSTDGGVEPDDTTDDSFDDGASFTDTPEPDTYQLLRADVPIAIVALRGDILVVSSDPDSDVDAIADGTQSGDAPRGKDGSLHALLGGSELGGVLVDTLGFPAGLRDGLTPFGRFAVTARAELGAVTIAVDTAAAD
ncbi:hypothetical protein [Paraconexibacter sp. AEG42_29]|uniref:hypothetical protein n=1 Tax=Paraconexibacter sp. AEG42_29 TaxID=2997339 RepID=UPI00339D8F11